MKQKGNNREKYRLTIEEGRAVLTAQSFRADRGSVLHSGIFSRELASSFVGAAFALLLLFVLYLTVGLNLLYYVVAAAVFWVVTFFSRVFLFKETYLETTIDEQQVKIVLHRPIKKRVIERRRDELKDIKIDYWRFEPENPDAVEFVERIALQHGTVIPGFGKVKEFYNLVLDFGEQAYTVLTLEDRDEIQRVMVKLKDFLGKGR